MTAAPDWTRLADDFALNSARVLEEGLRGPDVYVEALRRTFGAREPGDDGHRFPYPTVQRHTGLVTVAEADHERDACTIMDRLNAERLTAELRAAREETRRVYREARQDLAKAIRERVNDRTVPAKLRREGVLLAAEWLWPEAQA